LGQQVNFLAVSCHLSRDWIQAKAADLEDLGCHAVRPPEQRSYSGVQLCQVERLGEVVVGPGIEPSFFILDGPASGKHNNRRDTTCGAILGGDLLAAQPRQHPIQNHQIVLVNLEALQCLWSVIHYFHNMMLALERLLNRLREIQLVFDYENLCHTCSFYINDWANAVQPVWTASARQVERHRSGCQGFVRNGERGAPSGSGSRLHRARRHSQRTQWPWDSRNFGWKRDCRDRSALWQ